MKKDLVSLGNISKIVEGYYANDSEYASLTPVQLFERMMYPMWINAKDASVQLCDESGQLLQAFADLAPVYIRVNTNEDRQTQLFAILQKGYCNGAVYKIIHLGYVDFNLPDATFLIDITCDPNDFSEDIRKLLTGKETVLTTRELGNVLMERSIPTASSMYKKLQAFHTLYGKGIGELVFDLKAALNAEHFLENTEPDAADMQYIKDTMTRALSVLSTIETYIFKPLKEGE